MIRKILPAFFLLFFVSFGYAQDAPSSWMEVELSKKIIKNLKFEFNPELRLLGNFKMDSYILESGLSYKVYKYLTVASYYRYEDSYDYKNGTGRYKGQNSYNRLAFDIKPEYNLSRFNLQARVRLTKGLDEGNKATEMRYRAKIEYNVKGIKLVPYVSVELFNDKSVTADDKTLISGGFKDFNKIRYTAGMSYDVNKNNEVGLFYRLQDNRIKDKSTIIGLSLNHDF